MSEEHATEIKQGERVYRYACTEKIEIGGRIWMRDRYCNINGDKKSFLLVNFENTGIPIAMEPDMMQAPIYQIVEEEPKPKRQRIEPSEYIRQWKAQGLIK